MYSFTPRSCIVWCVKVFLIVYICLMLLCLKWVITNKHTNDEFTLTYCNQCYIVTTLAFIGSIKWHLFSLNYKAPTCDTEEPLVVGATPIPANHMTASSFHVVSSSTSYPPNYAVLHGTSAWCSSMAEKGAAVPNMYLQVSSNIFNLARVVCDLYTPF